LIRETRVSRVTPPNGGKSGLLSRDDRLCITCRGERAVRSKEWSHSSTLSTNSSQRTHPNCEVCDDGG
jgi:hypothetical protein